MIARREVEPFNLSFLDVICCGFGAVILLLVITKTVEPTIIEESTVELEGLIAQLEQQLYEIRGETRILNRELVSKEESLSEYRVRLARLQAELERIKGEFEASKQDSAVASVIAERLASARQDLTDEMKRLLGQDFRRAPSDTVGGIPVDSEYIIFVIDTSGSMFNYSWGMLLQKVTETLNVYPDVRGIQVMNDMGDYMFSRYRGKWIPDTPGRRKVIIDTLRTWNPFSNSSPVEGITRAIKDFYSPDKKISIYVFGDEFTGGSVDSVIEAVDTINRENEYGERLVRIHAVGFPVQFIQPERLQTTGIRFATLMRILCYRNGGTFVALDRFR